MNRKTRYFLIGSALVVGVGLGTGLVASYSSQIGGFSLARQTEFDYLPPDAAAIAYADVHDIKVIFVDEPDDVINPLGLKGVGEIGVVGVAAAIANAVYHATGKRVRDLPITLDKLLG